MRPPDLESKSFCSVGSSWQLLRPDRPAASEHTIARPPKRHPAFAPHTISERSRRLSSSCRAAGLSNCLCPASDCCSLLAALLRILKLESMTSRPQHHHSAASSIERSARSGLPSTSRQCCESGKTSAVILVGRYGISLAKLLQSCGLGFSGVDSLV